MERSAVLTVLFLYFSFTFAYSQVLHHDHRLYLGSLCKTTDGKNGICSTNCATRALTNAQLADRNNICGFEKKTALICCPRTVIDSASPYPTLLQACVERKEKAEDEIRTAADIRNRSKHQVEQRNLFQAEYSGYLPNKNSQLKAECEEEAQKIGGPSKASPVVINEHPHVAALGWKEPNGTIKYNCGGVLIHRSFVVSAAHCMFFYGTPDVVRVGDIHLFQSWDDKYAIDYNVEAVFSHLKYEPPKFYDSIALLKLKKRAEYRDKRPPLPACIWIGENYPTKKLLTMGYGAPGFGHRLLARRFQSYLTVLPHAECVKLYDPIVDMPKGIVDSQICAVDEAGILDTCVGDFGGPLQFTAKDGLKTPYLIGITTFGAQCLDGNPGVYLKLNNYLDWMEQVIRDYN